jgi:hypothetical protein
MEFSSFFFIFLLCISVTGFSQTDEQPLESSALWREGVIFNIDGTESTGLLRYNDQLGTVSYRDKEDNEYNFRAHDISGFQFAHRHLDEPDHFKSIESFNEKAKVSWDFYGLLMEMEQFKIWIKVEPLYPEIIRPATGVIIDPFYPGMIRPGTSPRSILKRAVILYFSTNYNNEFHELIKFETKSSISGIPDSPESDRRPKLKMKPFEKFIGSAKFEALKKYAKREKLNWKSKRDAIKILSHFNEL